MAFALTWLPGVLLEAGLKVAEVDGWQSRGRAEMGRVLGTMIHHTAGPRVGNMPSLKTLENGRSDLAGPLSQLGLGRDGTWYVIAAGRANHAGDGIWNGVRTGNSNFIGIECENSGAATDAWPEVQMLALRHGVAALMKHAGRPADWCCGHREYALPRGRKLDPLWDMQVFRDQVAALLSSGVPMIPQIPAAEPNSPPGTAPRPTLRRGSAGAHVVALQRFLGLDDDGLFGSHTEAAVRIFQRSQNLVPDGIVGPNTWTRVPREGQ
jgi:hypothetical protein